MRILRSNISFVMMGLSILLFLIAVTLNNHSETINVDVVAFIENVLAIFLLCSWLSEFP